MRLRAGVAADTEHNRHVMSQTSSERRRFPVPLPWLHAGTITGGATLDGGLALDPINGFHVAAGNTFDLMTFGADAEGFSSVFQLGGVACSGGLSGFWNCGAAGFNLDVSLTVSGLDVTVAGVPEPSTWALMATGFLGLVGLGLRGRSRELQTALLTLVSPESDLR